MGFFGKISEKFKIIIGVVLGILGFIFFGILRKNTISKDELEGELEAVKSETKIILLEEDKEANKEKLEELKIKEDEIREKITEIKLAEEEQQKLDDFFDDRGF